MLEQQMQDLKDLPGRVSAVESQILQLRDEMRSEFSATRSDLRGEFQREIHRLREELRDDIRIGVEESQNLARLLHADAIQATVAVRQDLLGRLEVLRDELRAEIQDGNVETRAVMRALHEETLTMIATMGNGRKGRKPKS